MESTATIRQRRKEQRACLNRADVSRWPWQDNGRSAITREQIMADIRKVRALCESLRLRWPD